MKNLLKAAPFVALLIVLSSCGGGSGGTPDPQPIADGVMDAIKGEKFAKVYDYFPDWQRDAAAKEADVRKWRMKEGWMKWKDYKKRFEGDDGLDPKDKSTITSGEDKWTGASAAERVAVEMGFYQIYTKDDWEKRVKESEWYLDRRLTKLEVEGQGSADFEYRNRYEDSVEIRCVREGSLWYLAGVKVNMKKPMPDKPKD